MDQNILKKRHTNTEKLEELVDALKVLSEPNRLLLLDQIIAGVQCNCELGKSLSMAPNLVSHHLSVLCDSGLIEARRDEKDRRWIFYSINLERLNALKQSLNAFFDENRIQSCSNYCGPKH